MKKNMALVVELCDDGRAWLFATDLIHPEAHAMSIIGDYPDLEQAATAARDTVLAQLGGRTIAPPAPVVVGLGVGQAKGRGAILDG